MTLEEFDRRMTGASDLRRIAKTVEQDILQDAGVHLNTKAMSSISGWTYDGAGRYWATPREALEAKQEAGK